MTKRINIKPIFAVFAAFFGTIGEAVKKRISKLKENRRAMWLITLVMRWALVILAIVAYTIAVGRYAQKKALETYAVWFEEYKIEQAEAAEKAAREAVETDPYVIQLNAEAEALSRVLYGVKDNSTDDLKTYCWCVFNRVDNPNYPSTLEDVIAQPSQWMRYDPTNPILENLYQIAREQLDEWHTNTHRPVSSEYVFMNWSKNDICLRDNFYEGSGTHYWRFGQ